MSSVGDFEGDADLNGDMKFKNLLFSCDEYAKLSLNLLQHCILKKRLSEIFE